MNGRALLVTYPDTDPASNGSAMRHPIGCSSSDSGKLSLRSPWICNPETFLRPTCRPADLPAC